AGAIYHCADDEPLTYYDFMKLTADALGLGPPRRIPAWLARLAAGRHVVGAVVRSARSDNSLLKDELGWSPRYPSAAVGVPDAEAARLFPSFGGDDLAFVLLEPEAGVLRARRAVRALARAAEAHGARLVRARARPEDGFVALDGGRRLSADVVVWACGSWLAG